MKLIIITFLSFFLLSCYHQASDIQHIVIDNYPDEDQNYELIFELLNYDLKQLSLPSYSKRVLSGIRFDRAYCCPNLENVVYLRVYYNLSIPEISKNIDILKKDFESTIKELAKIHFSKKNHYIALEPIGTKFLNNYLSKNIDQIWEDSSKEFKQTTSIELIKERIKTINDKYGKIIEFQFRSVEFYPPLNTATEKIFLSFICRFENQRFVSAVLDLVENNGQLKVNNYSVYGINIKSNIASRKNS